MNAPTLRGPVADGDRRDHVGSLAKGLALVEILAANPAGLTLSETAERADLTRAGARRLLLTLVACGWAAQRGRIFTLSARPISVARHWIGSGSLWAYAEPFMREVATALDESCSAAVLDGDDVVYVARVPGRKIVSIALHVGTRLPAWSTSMGRVLLAGLPAAEFDGLLAGATIRPLTDRTVTDPAMLARIVQQAGRDGYALVDQELEPGLRSIAAPIRDRSGRTVAAVNVSTQAARAGVEEMTTVYLPRLRAAARAIEDYFVLQ